MALLARFALTTDALQSKSNSYSNTRSAIDASGETMVAGLFYANESSFGEIAQTTHTSASFQTRSGLMSIYKYPGQVTSLFASTGPTVGQVFLQWIAPGNDGYQFNTQARDYLIVYSTTATQSPASSDANFNAATFIGSPPSPTFEGQPQQMVLTGLMPGVTYYFAIKAQEADGLESPLSLGATAMATTGITAITDLRASSGPFQTQITLQWTAPFYSSTNPPLSYQIHASTTANMFNNNDFAAAAPLSAFSTATIPGVLAGGTAQSMTVVNLLPCRLYFFAIRAVDSGTPQDQGLWNRDSALGLNVYNFSTAGCTLTKAPNVPLNVVASTQSPTAVAVGWSAVTMLNDGTPFASSSAPIPSELFAYHVMRATSPVASAVWTEISGPLSPQTTSFLDTAGGTTYYYYVIAQNLQGNSLGSNERSVATGDVWAVSDDGLSTLDVPAAFTGTLTNYYIAVSSNPQNVGGPVLKSIAFSPMINGLTYDQSFKLPATANLLLHYNVNGTGGVMASALAPTAPTTPQQLSIFWYNGNQWLQVYGQVNTGTQNVFLQTPYFGQYELRSTERVGGFTFNDAGLSNRFITPNGDRKNDNTVFTFNNPQFSNVTGRVFDLRGHFVANMATPPLGCPSGPGQCLMWDGRSSNGTVATGGVYVYQLEGENKTFNGTIVVVR